MCLNVFDIAGAVLGIVSAIVPLVQVPLAIQAEKRRAQPTQQNLHMMHRSTRHRR